MILHKTWDSGGLNMFCFSCMPYTTTIISQKAHNQYYNYNKLAMVSSALFNDAADNHHCWSVRSSCCKWYGAIGKGNWLSTEAEPKEVNLMPEQ